MKKTGLGKGLDALFEDNNAMDVAGAQLIKISEITPNKDQPRKDFAQEALEQLADSIREHGVLQPLIIRPMPFGGYQIVAGERRYRACRMIGLTEVPAMIREFSDAETMEVALIENLQREDLNPIEEALGYRELIDVYHMTQEEVAKRVGKSRPVIANALRLLNLPEEIRTQLRLGAITVGHARALLGFGDDQKALSTMEKVMNNGLTVRDVEKMVSASKEPQVELSNTANDFTRNSFYSEVELALSEEFGRTVTVTAGKKKGILSIEFYGQEDLQALAKRVSEVFGN